MSRIKPEVAQKRIKSFTKSFGEAHLYLAYHAAFPLALTPDLLYGLWVNFQKDIQGKVLGIPWIAVADLLLSVLCDEVGHELYEMDLAVRNQLLEGLRSDERFGEERIEELSDFLLEYAQKHLQSDDPDIQDFAKTQKWIALAYTKPTQAARELALELSKLDEYDKPELVRMASLTETLAEPLAEFEPLLMYAYGIGEFAGGDLKSATAVFSEVVGKRNEVQINEINLPVPKEIIQEIQSQDKPTKSQKNPIIINTTTVLSYINLRIFIGAVSLASTSFPILFTNPSFFIGISSVNAPPEPPESFLIYISLNYPLIEIPHPSSSPIEIPLESSSVNRLPELRYGDKGNSIRILQRLFQSCLTRYDVKVTGSFDVRTEAAVKAFQSNNGMVADGIVGSRTWRQLTSGKCN